MELPGYGRPRVDAGAYPGRDLLIHRPVAPGPGSEGAAPWAEPGEAGYLVGEGWWVKTDAPTWGRNQKSYPEADATGTTSADYGGAAAAAVPSCKNAETLKMDVDPEKIERSQRASGIRPKS